jgi:hypothetical protein
MWTGRVRGLTDNNARPVFTNRSNICTVYAILPNRYFRRRLAAERGWQLQRCRWGCWWLSEGLSWGSEWRLRESWVKELDGWVQQQAGDSAWRVGDGQGRLQGKVAWGRKGIIGEERAMRGETGATGTLWEVTTHFCVLQGVENNYILPNSTEGTQINIQPYMWAIFRLWFDLQSSYTRCVGCSFRVLEDVCEKEILLLQ